jgi:hypothetical protein
MTFLLMRWISWLVWTFTLGELGGLGLCFVTLAHADSYGWSSYYGGANTEYYAPSYSGYSGYSGGSPSGIYGRPPSYGSNVISLDLDPQSLLNSSFRVASRERRLPDVMRFLSEGAEVDSRSESGETALMHAARNCGLKLADFLLLHGANVNAADFEGRTPLILAARESCIQVVQRLLTDPSIEMDAQDQTRKAAIDYARENALLEVGGPSAKIIGLIESSRKKLHALKRQNLGKGGHPGRRSTPLG